MVAEGASRSAIKSATRMIAAPRMILARIAGIPEERANALAEGPLDAFLRAIGE